MRWGILGAAKFAREHMGPAIHTAKGAELYGLATSDATKAEPFSAFAPHLKVYSDYNALLDDPNIDAVYIPLPNTLHVDWSIKALKAGKHVLCEKPIAMQASDFDQLEVAAKKANKLCAEAFMIVHHPQFIRARELVQGGAIGQLMHVDTVFSYNNAGDTDNIRNKSDMGGGGLRDIGVYNFGAARFVTGAEPVRIADACIRYENGVDTFAQIAADFPDFTYSSVTSIRMQPRQEINFHGDKGLIRLTCPFNANLHDVAQLVLENDGQRVVTERWPAANHYVLQVENFGRAARGETAYPCPLSFSRGTQVMMDMVFAAGGPA